MNEVRNDALTLMTLHLCKGLEFRNVMITGCEEGIFPHANALFDKEQLEEERRLMYVGMTRAKDHLRLLCAQSRTLWGEIQANDSSRFLDDLPPDLVERKSSDIMSAVLWRTPDVRRGAPSGRPGGMGHLAHAGHQTTTKTPIEDIEFNQDLNFSEEDINQDTFEQGTRITHPHFGEGTVLSRHGDVVEVQFDSGQKKKLALSIAPLQTL